MSLSRILRQDIAPVGSAYLGFLALFVWYGRHRRHPEADGGRPGARRSWSDPLQIRWPAFVRQLAGTLAGGYLFFASVILIFYLVLGGQAGNFIPQSLTQGAVLAFAVVLPAFAVLTWTEAAWRRRRTSRASKSG